MIVDCHTHIDFSADEVAISEHLAAAETVDRCIVLAVGQADSRDINKKLADYISRHQEKMVGFAVVEPTKDNVGIKNIRDMTVKQGLSGIVLHCAASGFHPAHSRAMRLYDAAEELALPIFFHGGRNISDKAVLDYVQPMLLDEIARRFPSLKIVIGTMGVPFVDQTIAMLAKHKNVYADLTILPDNVWQVYNMVVAAYERRVMGKLLFGSGFPSGGPGVCIETLLGFNKLLGGSSLPIVPRGEIRNVIERDALACLAITKE